MNYQVTYSYIYLHKHFLKINTILIFKKKQCSLSLTPTGALVNQMMQEIMKTVQPLGGTRGMTTFVEGFFFTYVKKIKVRNSCGY